MLTSPNEIVPLQIGRGAMRSSSPSNSSEKRSGGASFLSYESYACRLHNEYMAGISLWTVWTVFDA